MYNIKLTLSYKGTNYYGFQIQKNSQQPTIQLQLEKALSKIYNDEIKVISCSRTDAGVHAKGQVVNYRYREDRFKDERRLILALNANLPEDIRVVDSKKVDIDFHARYHAKAKRYSYLIDNSVAHRPLLQEISYHVYYNLDLSKMKKTGEYLVGTHDFSSFKGSQGATKTTERTIKMLTINKQDQYIKIDIEGNGFLYNMVRIIVGTLIQAGKGKMEPQEILEILKAKDRTKAGPTAPAQGLTLERIYY